ncbi:MAG: gamma carbonic anhydrase family protein [Cyclobacteriaceae bacterium]
MALIQSVRGCNPKLGEACFVAPNATIVGDVIIGDHCSFWFNIVVRGDVNKITIGDKTNVQDGVIIHCTYQKYATSIGNNVSLGHGAIIHGCTIEDEVLVGMGAIILDGAVIKKGCVIAAGAVVLSGTITEPGFMYAGAPARKIKPVDKELKKVVADTPDRYIKYADWYSDS